jgi:hypothetical protein
MHPVRFASVAVFDASPQASVSHQGPTSEGGHWGPGARAGESEREGSSPSTCEGNFRRLPLFRRQQDMPFSKPGVALLSLVARRTSEPPTI